MLQKKNKTIIIFIAIIVLLILCIYTLEFNPIKFITSLPMFFYFLITKFFPPNLMSLGKYVNPILDTIAVAIVATVIATIIASILSFLVAKSTTPFKIISNSIRSILSLFRNIPMIVWASLLAIVFGIGITAGTFALIIFSVSFLTRVLAEAIDDIDPEILLALESVGASKLEVIRHAIIPSFIPSFYSWFLFLIEINIKASSILGLVGAGGLGYELKKSLDLFHYHEAAALLVVLSGMLLIIEFISSNVRRRLI